MLGIFLIYWVGRKYYDLAIRHGRSAWGYCILAIVIYYGSQFFLGIILALSMPELMANLDSGEEMALNFIGIPISLGVWYSVLVYLRKKWEAIEESMADKYESEIEKIGAIDTPS
jgi:cytochrome b561